MAFDSFFDDNTAAKSTAVTKNPPKQTAAVTSEMEDFFGQPAPAATATQQASENPTETVAANAGSVSEPESTDSQQDDGKTHADHLRDLGLAPPKAEPESQDESEATTTTTETASESVQEHIVSVAVGPQMDERERQFIELGNRVSILKIRINDLSARQAAMEMELESVLDQQNAILEDLADDVELDPIPSTPAVVSNAVGVAFAVSVPESKPSQADSHEPTSKPSQVTNPSPVNGEWRNSPISVLPLDTINRFGKKKIEALQEAAPTIGRLYDMIHNGGINVKGVGDDSKDAIGTMLAEWLESNVAATAS